MSEDPNLEDPGAEFSIPSSAARSIASRAAVVAKSLQIYNAPDGVVFEAGPEGAAAEYGDHELRIREIIPGSVTMRSGRIAMKFGDVARLRKLGRGMAAVNAEGGSGSAMTPGFPDSEWTFECGDPRLLDGVPADGAGGCTARVSIADFKRMLRRNIPAVSHETTRRYLNGICMHPDGDDVVAVSTTGHVLMLTRMKNRAAAEAGNEDEGETVGRRTRMIIHKRALGILAMLADGGEPGDMVEIGFAEEGFATFETKGKWKVGTVPINGTYPDYRKAIPDREDVVVAVNSDRLHDYVKEAARSLEKNAQGHDGGMIFGVSADGGDSGGAATMSVSWKARMREGAEEGLPDAFSGFCTMDAAEGVEVDRLRWSLKADYVTSMMSALDLAGSEIPGEPWTVEMAFAIEEGEMKDGCAVMAKKPVTLRDAREPETVCIVVPIRIGLDQVSKPAKA